MKKSVNSSFIQLTIVVFLGLTFPLVMQEGLFMDGLIYSTLSSNLSSGIGTYWNPSFSETIMNSFHGHPPLGFILESFLFDLLGNEFYVEKIYSFFTCLLTAFFIIKIWVKISYSKEIKKLYWLPILLWITVPRCFWAYNNNMLENTMGLFSIASLYCLLIALNKKIYKQILLFCISGALMLLSFLSKGFPGLFPLAFFLLYTLVNLKTYRIKKMLFHSSLLIILSSSIWFLFFYFNVEAKENILEYLDIQVFSSLSGKGVVGSRWHIMNVLFQELLIIISITILLIISKYKTSLKQLKDKPNALRLFLLFTLIGLSASVPIMISPKQLGFYITPSLPYFSIAFSILIAHIVHEYLNKININSTFFKVFKHQGYILFPLILIYSFYNYGSYSRNHNMIQDIEIISEYIPRGSTISISKQLSKSWSLMAYCQRKFNINLDKSMNLQDYMLIKKDEPVIDDYIILDIRTKDFSLIKKNKAP
jgi:hypothetical protein